MHAPVYEHNSSMQASLEQPSPNKSRIAASEDRIHQWPVVTPSFADAAHGPSIGPCRHVGNLFQLCQALGDDLGRLQRRLAQGRILNDLALNPRGLALEHVARRL